MPEDKTTRNKLRALDNYGIYMSKRYSLRYGHSGVGNSFSSLFSCGIQYIWDHYGLIDVEKMAKDATKKVNYDKDGLVVIK